MESTISFGTLLRRYREAAGLSQEELAERSGLTAKGIGALERGERQRPYPHTIRALAEALGLSEAARAAFAAAIPQRGQGTPAPADAPASQASQPVQDTAPRTPLPSDLPGQLTDMIGRESETAVVLNLLARPEVRLLTLTGPGGVGKTRLALQVAAGVNDAFPDGVVFVALAPVEAPALVTTTIAQAIGAREAPGPAPLDNLAAALRGKQVLLLLDNFEQVVEAAPQLTALLLQCPRLKILATSRVPLRLQGEQEYRVPPLGLPTPGQTGQFDALRESPAMRLFQSRARAVESAFALTPANAGTVARICTHLDGLPLAIELAAARVALLPPAALLSRLEGGLHILAGGPRDLPARQQTMRATIAWSYDLLDEEAQALLRRLAVFVGGCTLEAAEAICAVGPGEETILGRLADLIRDNLLQRTELEEAGEADETALRIDMLVTIRAYAWEHLAASDELATLQQRHAAYFHALTREAQERLLGPDQVAWLPRLDRETHNLRAARQFLLGSGDPERAIGLTFALWRFWWVRGLQGEARRAMEDALALPQPLAPRYRAQALVTLGSMAWSEGDHRAAWRALEEGLALCDATGEEWGAAVARMMLGLLAGSEGDDARAQGYFDAGLRYFRATDRLWGAAFILGYQGLPALLRGDFPRATALFAESLSLARASGDLVATHQALYNLGLLAQAQDEHALTAERFAEGLTLAAEIRDVLNAGYLIKGLGEVAQARGQTPHAARLLGAADTLLRAAGSPWDRYAPDRRPDEQIAALRAALGDREFAQLWAEGRALSLDQAIAEALAVAGA